MAGFFNKKLTPQNKILLGIFLFLLIICTLTPIAGDDWGNYLVGKQGLNSVIDTAINMYHTWEGRFVSRLLLLYLTYHKWIWNILNAAMITLLISSIYKYLRNENNKVVLIIPILALLLVNVPFSSQCYLWLAGNMTYLFPAVISIATFTYIYKKEGNISNIWNVGLLTTISFLVPMFVENIGCAYVFGLFTLLIYYYKKYKKISIPITSMLILAIIALILMLTSPGSQIRMSMNEEFINMNLFEKIFHNIPNFIKYAFTKNIFILILMLIPINKLLIDGLKNKKNRKLVIILFNIIPVITILQNSIYMLPIGISRTYDGILSTSNWYYIFYWIIFGLLYILSIFKYIKNKKDKEYIFILLLIALSSMGVMLLTPIWGERVSALYIFIIILSTTRILSEFNINLKLSKFLNIALIFIIIINTGYSVVNKLFDIRRNNTIKEQLNNTTKEVYIYYNGITTLWNYTPFEEYHINTFKRYREIDENIKLTVKFPSKIQYIEYLITGNIK